jgi:hypothetical protein
LLTGIVGLAVAVRLGFPVTVKTPHALLIVHVRRSTELPGKFRVDPAAMAEGARLSLVLLDERVTLEQAKINTADCGTLYVTITARRVTASAGLLEHLCVKCFLLGLGKAARYAMAQTGRRVVNGGLVVSCFLFVTGGADIDAVGRPLHETLMGFFSGLALVVALVARPAALGEVRVFLDGCLVYEKTPIE